MANTQGLVLKLLMTSKNSEQALLAFSRIKEKHFSESFKPVFTSLHEFYTEFHVLPTLADLGIYRSRSGRVQTILSSIKSLDITDLDLEVATEALLDDHSQDVALDLVKSFVDSITLLSRQEMQEYLSRMPLEFEESVEAPEMVLTTNELTAFKSQEETASEAVILGLSNKWDTTVPSRVQELALYGGRRGSGKSILCANITANQMAMGNVGVYVTIEMTGNETYERILSICTGVNATDIKNNTLSTEQIRTIAKWLASKYNDSDGLLAEFLTESAPNPIEFEKTLKSTCTTKTEGGLVIVDDRSLSLAGLDIQLAKLKSRHGDKFKVAVVDYINQIVWDGHESDMYDWKVQTVIAKQLKNLARKYEILIVSPYQMDDSGEARFSKGILDACDTAQLIEPDEETSTITLMPTKVRGGSDKVITTVPIDWNCLTISPEEVDIAEMQQPSGEMEEELF